MSVECKSVCLFFMYLQAVVCMVQLSSVSGLANITVTVSAVQSGPVRKAQGSLGTGVFAPNGTINT